MPYQPYRGDLVRLTLIEGDDPGHEYLGIVLEVASAESCRVFVANGMSADFEPRKLKPVPLYFGAGSTSNFMEILAGKPMISVEWTEEG